MWHPLTPHDVAALPPLWREPVAGFSTALTSAGRTASTRAEYEHFVCDLARSHPDRQPWQLTPDDVRSWLDSRRWSTSTERKAVNAARRFYAHGIAAGHLAKTPLLGIWTRPDGPRRPGPPASSAPTAWAAPIREYVAYLRAGGRSPSTVRLRRLCLGMMGADFADPWQVTRHDLVLWLGREDWSLEYRRSLRFTVRGFYAWAAEAGHVQTSPAATLPAITLPRTVPRPATDDAVARALAAADQRTRLAVLLGALAGLRRAEIAAVHRDHITPGGLRVTGKGGHQRVVPLVPALAEALRAEYAHRDHETATTGAAASGWLFPSPVDPTRHLQPGTIGKIVGAVLPPGVTAHALRHRFATQSYQTARDVFALQTLLGHSKPETTARYASVSPDALRAALDGVSLPTMPMPDIAAKRV